MTKREKSLLHRLRRSGALAALLAASLGVAGVAHAVIVNMGATIDGLQEVPPNPSPGSGSATVVVDTDANTATFNIVFGGLIAPETAAHFHGFAAPGATAGVLFTLPPGSPKIGVWNYTEAQETGILSGLTYINIHSTAFPAGEIRGQVVTVVNATEPTTWGAIKGLYR